jgi:hypothetical protein
VGTLFAIILAIGASVISLSNHTQWELSPLPMVLGAFFLALALCEMLVLATSFVPLQRGEQNLTPRILELFKKDRQIIWINRGIIFITLAMLFIIFYQVPLPINPFLCMLIALGALFDLLHSLINKIFNYLNPFTVSKMFTKEAKKSIVESRETDLCDSIESLTEVSLKSLNYSSASLCNHGLDELREIMQLFLAGSKTIALNIPDEQAKESGITDKVSYTLFYFFERIELIFHKALRLNLSNVCTAVITLLGKITMYAANCDLSLASYAIHFIGKFSKQAETKGFSEVALKGTCTLVEVSKKIINEVPLAYMDLKDPFFSVITQLDSIAKESFRQNKESSIPFLIAPFQDLRALFQSPKVASHPDTPSILNQINSVIAEWDALSIVLATLPPIDTKDKNENTEEKKDHSEPPTPQSSEE